MVFAYYGKGRGAGESGGRTGLSAFMLADTGPDWYLRVHGLLFFSFSFVRWIFRSARKDSKINLPPKLGEGWTAYRNAKEECIVDGRRGQMIMEIRNAKQLSFEEKKYRHI